MVERLGEASRPYFKSFKCINCLLSLGREPFPQAPCQLMPIDKTDVRSKKLSKGSQYAMEENAKIEKVCDTDFCTL